MNIKIPRESFDLMTPWQRRDALKKYMTLKAITMRQRTFSRYFVLTSIGELFLPLSTDPIKDFNWIENWEDEITTKSFSPFENIQYFICHIERELSDLVNFEAELADRSEAKDKP